ncbi:MAG: addiction module antidote protein [Xanthobacteraceae bacterium]
MNTVFVGGSRQVSRLPAIAKERLQNVTTSGAHVVVGDANGADKAVQKFLFDANYQYVTVFCSGKLPRNNIGKWEINNVTPPKGVSGFSFYAAKDREMAQRADYGLMIWDGKSPGTVLNILRLLKAGKKAVLLNTHDKSALNFRTGEDWSDFFLHMTDEFRSDLRKRATEDEWAYSEPKKQPSFFDQVTAALPETPGSADPDEAEATLNAALASGNLSLVVDALGTVAKARGMSQVSKETGLARESLYRSLSVGGNPEFSTVWKVIASVGLRLMVGKASSDQ